MHFFVDYMRGLASGWRPSSGGWVAGNCPVCVRAGEERPDIKSRGGFHFDNDEWVYHCFNCKFATGWTKGSLLSGGARMLLDGFGIQSSDLQRINIQLMREQETTQLLNPMPAPKPEFHPVWPEIELPDDSQLLNDIIPDQIHNNFEEAIVMLSDRQLLHWTDWAYTASDFKYRKRIILPYRYDDKLVGYTARYIGVPPTCSTPKYLNTKPPHFVFNLGGQKPDRNFVVVTEGDFDAISMDGVSLGSNSISDEQASLINQLKRRTILLPDADKAGNELIDPAIKHGWSVSFPEWMELYKDANSASCALGRIFVLRSVLEAATNNPTKIRVLAKKYLKDNT